MQQREVKFTAKVDKRSKKAMATFLAEHFRYDTMSSWNRSTSYANDVKIHNVVPSELQDKAYDIIGAEDAYFWINDMIAEWNAEQGYVWQVAFNGRSGGYLVLYQGGSKPSEHKRICRSCGQKNFKAESVKCGRCGSDNMHDYAGVETYAYGGRGTDDEMDLEGFMEWDMYQLRNRVELVQKFDALCDAVVDQFIEICKDYDAIEEVEYVPTTVKRLHEVGA
jgi:ribosomal protein L37E